MDDEIQHLRSEIERLQKIIDGKQQVAPTSLIDNAEFVADCCRYAEGIFSKQGVKRKWHFADDTIWTKLAKDEALIEAIELEKTRRVRNGQAKREKAQQLVIAGPDILSSIASDKSASPRHRVDAIKTLDGMSDTGPKTTPEMGERFHIVINLGEDRLLIDKSIAPIPNDKDIEIIDNTPQLTDQSGDDQ